MNQYSKISDLKDAAKGKLSGQFGGAVLANFIPSLTTFSVVFVLTMFLNTFFTASLIMSNNFTEEMLYQTTPGQSIATYLLTQVVSVFIGVFQTGIALYFLNLACGRTASVSDLFYGFKYLFRKSLTISVVMTLLDTIFLMPYNVFYILYTTEGSLQWGIYTVVALVAGGILYLPVSLALSQSYFLLLDFPQYSAKELMLLSIRIMKGKKRNLFTIQLSFLPLMLLSMLTLGIGDLWLTPFMNMTMALYFLDIMRPKAATQNAESTDVF